MAERLTRLLLDTSVVIAGSPALGAKPGDTAAISVITLGEMRIRDRRSRRRRPRNTGPASIATRRGAGDV